MKVNKLRKNSSLQLEEIDWPEGIKQKYKNQI